MQSIRILVANEPRCYREVMAAAFKDLRPQYEIIVGDPDRLEDEILTIHPNLVLCSHLSDALMQDSLSWVVLYPDGESYATVRIDGKQDTIQGIEFDGLLTMLDRVQGLAAGS